LVIATRMRDSAFKRVLRQAALGTKLKVEGPSGSFVLHRKVEKPAVFLAGGIGITPFRSMIVDVHMRRLRRELWLFYANRRPEDAAFLHEMRALSAVMPAFHVVATVTAPEGIDASWTGERGRLDLPMVRRWLPDLQVPTYYIAGPPDMVAAFHRLLVGAGVSRRSVRVEEFTGY